jgi:hypothetical protein
VEQQEFDGMKIWILKTRVENMKWSKAIEVEIPEIVLNGESDIFDHDNAREML